MFSHNSPSDRARKLFKSSKHEENLVVSIKKNWEVFDLNSFVGDVIIVAGLRCLDDVIEPWALPARGNFWFLSFEIN